jgi:hypothetical protein
MTRRRVVTVPGEPCQGCSDLLKRVEALEEIRPAARRDPQTPYDRLVETQIMPHERNRMTTYEINAPLELLEGETALAALERMQLIYEVRVEECDLDGAPRAVWYVYEDGSCMGVRPPEAALPPQSPRMRLMTEPRQSKGEQKIQIGIKHRRCWFCKRFIARSGTCGCGGLTTYDGDGRMLLALRGNRCWR